jgi:carbon-monoxide dehydrogenase medium subunit
VTLWKTYYTPTSVDEALRLLAEHGPEARIIAGGTDLLLELERGLTQTQALIDVSRIPKLGRIRKEDGQLRLGAMATHNRLVAAKSVAERAFPLAQACWSVGAPALRNRATLGGNLVTASPANDTITPLWAMGATLVLRSTRGERTLSFPEFYQGVRQVELAPDEMLTEVQVPMLAPNQRGAFVKLGLRKAMAISVVNAAVVLTFDEETVTHARITLGSVAPTIVRATEAEQLLQGRPLNARRARDAANLAAESAVPIDDIRAGAEYRRRIVRVLVRRALEHVLRGDERSEFPAAPPMLWGRTKGRCPPLAGKTIRHTIAGDEPIECNVNGENHIVRGANGKTLLDMLRQDLGLTGTKEGCGEGECGACTIWLDGIAALACLIPAPRAHGACITTIEGLAEGEELHPVQRTFIEEGAVQCGYCIPGFVMSGAKLLEELPQPDREQILYAISGNLCRCTGYHKIVRAIERGAEEMADGTHGS